MNNKDFVHYEEALELKELGFNEPCFGYHSKDNGVLNGNIFTGMVYDYQSLLLAPLYQQAFRWFRDNHELDGFVEGRGYNNKKY
jgi:hypothetical protein